MSKETFRRRVTPVPGILIDLTMLGPDGVYVSIERDEAPEVYSIYLPDKSFLEFAEHINEAAKMISHG